MAPMPPAPSDTRDQLLLLWRHRVLILGLAVVLSAAAAVFSLVRTRQFEATATVSVSASRLGDNTPGRVPPETFVPLMATPAIAAGVIDELKLAGHSTTTLLGNVVTVRAVPESALIRIVVRMPAADEAARVANSFAAHAVAAATRAGRIDVEAIQGELKQMLDEATARLRAAEKAYDDFRVSARIEMLEREVETLVGQRGELMDVVVELESERARLARLEGELGKHDRVTSLRQSVVDDPALSEVARDGGSTSRELLGVQMTRESANPVFQNLDEETARSRAHVAYLEQQRVRLAQAAGLDGSQLARLTQLYERESALEQLDIERKLARKSYEDIAGKYQGTRLAAVGRTPQLLVVDPALAPERPVARYLTRNVMLGATAGLLLGCIIVVLRQALSGRPDEHS
jgi:uncharacterized protein involved in exopolysaccharide biosynthesis